MACQPWAFLSWGFEERSCSVRRFWTSACPGEAASASSEGAWRPHRPVTSSVPSITQRRSQKGGYPSVPRTASGEGGQGPGGTGVLRTVLTGRGHRRAWQKAGRGHPPPRGCRLPRGELWAPDCWCEGTLLGAPGAWTWGRWSLGAFGVSGQMEPSRNGGPFLACSAPPREGEGLSESRAGQGPWLWRSEGNRGHGTLLEGEYQPSPGPMVPEMLEKCLQTCRWGFTSHGGTDPRFVPSCVLQSLFSHVAPPRSSQRLHVVWVCKTHLTAHVLRGVAALCSFPL